MKLVFHIPGEGIGSDDVGFIALDVATLPAVDDAVGILAVVLSERDFIAGRPRRNVEQLRPAAV